MTEFDQIGSDAPDSDTLPPQDGDQYSSSSTHESRAHSLTSLLLDGFRNESGDTAAGNFAVMYSGGLDSAVISMIGRMTLGRERFTLHTFGVPGSRDLDNAREGITFIDMPWMDHILTGDDIHEAANSLLAIIPDLSFLELSFELPLFLGASTIHEDIIITGQGADELFGGYAKYREITDPLARMLMLDKDRVRLFTRTRKIEAKIAEHFGKTLITPFLGEAIIQFTSSLKLDDLMDMSGGNKLVLRETGRILGLPEHICSRPKLAAQYGSGISKVLKRQRKKGLLNLIDPTKEATNENAKEHTNGSSTGSTDDVIEKNLSV